MTKRNEIEKSYEEKVLNRRCTNLDFAEKGVEFFDLGQADIDPEAKIGSGTYIGPGVVVKGATVIGGNCRIEQGTRIENCEIGDGTTVDHSVLTDSKIGTETTVGPFAYIRPNSKIGNHCRIGDYVEIKNSEIGDGTKISHLSYVGDSDLGAGINIGCGVVFVNYDGWEKRRSVVGDGAFIGCNVNLVAPVNIGAGAYIAAGGTVTSDVAPGALFIARDRGRSIDEWVEKRGGLKKKL